MKSKKRTTPLEDLIDIDLNGEIINYFCIKDRFSRQPIFKLKNEPMKRGFKKIVDFLNIKL